MGYPFASGDVLAASDLNSALGVVQVKSTNSSTAFSTTSTSFVDVTGLSVSITPKSSSNSILLFVNTNVSSSGTVHAMFQVDRSGTAIINSNTFGSFFAQSFQSGWSDVMFPISGAYLDSPSTTSALTYKLQVRNSGVGNTTYVNRRADIASVVAISNITVMEIGV